MNNYKILVMCLRDYLQETIDVDEDLNGLARRAAKDLLLQFGEMYEEYNIYKIQKEDGFRDYCLDCTKSTYQLDEYYMVKDNIWNKVTKKEKGAGMLCIGCLEKRMGRKLTFVDFTHCPLNCVPTYVRSFRLLSRLETI